MQIKLLQMLCTPIQAHSVTAFSKMIGPGVAYRHRHHARLQIAVQPLSITKCVSLVATNPVRYLVLPPQPETWLHSQAGAQPWILASNLILLHLAKKYYLLVLVSSLLQIIKLPRQLACPTIVLSNLFHL